jgi:hypothetical protein
LGTRHRAGIGITEETDAVAVIVSEETGSISLAVAGKIESNLTVEQLRGRLGSELRRYMSPVALPTAISQSDRTNTDEPLRTRAHMGVDGDSESEPERPL